MLGTTEEKSSTGMRDFDGSGVLRRAGNAQSDAELVPPALLLAGPSAVPRRPPHLKR